EKVTSLEATFDTVNPADLTRRIVAIQTRLITLAAAKTAAQTLTVSRAKPDEAREPLSRAS
ncbi:MAG TPA: hypothetical protein VF362_02035, partial [Demequinaceae bacterium]